MKLNYRNEINARFIAAAFNKPLDKPDWYKIENVSDDEASILLFDFIGWPYNEAGDFIRALSDLKQGKIVIRINSPGGDVWDANAIHNAIKSHPSKPITRIESLAASAASYIAVAGHKREAYKNAMVMIHEPMTGMYGNQYDLKETADILGQVSDSLIDMYADNTNVGKRELKEMMKNETWMRAKVAKEKGFIDTIIDNASGTKAQFDLSIFANIPNEFKENKELTERDAERILRDAGFSRSKAKAAVARCKADAVDNKDEMEVEVVKAELNKLLSIMTRY
jgi:ATP-dependent Clp endopeptidase proteolytic subunit ClpP